MSNQLPHEALQQISKDLSLPDEKLPQHTQNAEQFRAWLAKQIAYQMETNMESFLQALYRLDISEKKAMLALSNQTELPPALALADLVIEREIQKINTRNWYKQQMQQQPPPPDDENNPDRLIADTWD